jgi:hypothetical protein
MLREGLSQGESTGSTVVSMVGPAASRFLRRGHRADDAEQHCERNNRDEHERGFLVE